MVSRLSVSITLSSTELNSTVKEAGQRQVAGEERSKLFFEPEVLGREGNKESRLALPLRARMTAARSNTVARGPPRPWDERAAAKLPRSLPIPLAPATAPHSK